MIVISHAHGFSLQERDDASTSKRHNKCRKRKGTQAVKTTDSQRQQNGGPGTPRTPHPGMRLLTSAANSS